MARGSRGTSQPFLRPGSKNWYVRYTVPGEKTERVESTGTRDEKEAKRILNKKRTAIDDAEIGPRGVTVGHLLDLYLTGKRKSGKPCQNSEAYVRLHLRPAFGTLLAERITTQKLDAFIEQKKAAKKSNASINRWLEALNRAYTIGREENDPPLIRKKPKIVMLDESGNVREGFLTRDEYEELLRELPSHLQTLLVLGYHLGMRRGELVKLRWSQIDWHANQIRLQKTQTKNKQARVAPLYGEMRAWLEAIYPGRGADTGTIVALDGVSISETKTAWGSARKRAGLPNVMIHDLRRTAVRNMVRAGIPEKTAMLISGHKTRSMFDRYTIIDERDIELAGQRLETFEAMERKVRAEVRAVDPNMGSDEPTGNEYKA